MSVPGPRLSAHVGKARCDHCGGEPSLGHGDEMRCGCGSLLARLVAGGVEVKCRRCKRTVVLLVEKEAPALSGGT